MGGIMNHDRGVITMMMLIKEAVKNYLADFFRQGGKNHFAKKKLSGKYAK